MKILMRPPDGLGRVKEVTIGDHPAYGRDDALGCRSGYAELYR